MEVLTYNVRMAELGLDANLGSGHRYVGLLRNRDRAKMMLPRLREREPDVVVFTELFAPVPRDILLDGTRSVIETVVGSVVKFIPLVGRLVEAVTREELGDREGGLRDHGYEATERPGESSIRNGGVLVASRLEIEHWETHVYRSGVAGPIESVLQNHGIDVSQQKGIVYAALRDGDQRYHVFGTHLQHGCDEDQLDARLDQLDELATFVADQPVGDEPVVVAGDLNIGWNQPGNCARIGVADVVAAFDAVGIDVGEVAPLETATTLGGEALDHVFLANAMVSSGRYEVLQWIQEAAADDPLPNQFVGPDGRRHLSDHHPLLADIHFTDNPLLDRSWRSVLDDILLDRIRRYLP